MITNDIQPRQSRKSAISLNKRNLRGGGIGDRRGSNGSISKEIKSGDDEAEIDDDVVIGQSDTNIVDGNENSSANENGFSQEFSEKNKNNLGEQPPQQVSTNDMPFEIDHC